MFEKTKSKWWLFKKIHNFYAKFENYVRCTRTFFLLKLAKIQKQMLVKTSLLNVSFKIIPVQHFYLKNRNVRTFVNLLLTARYPAITVFNCLLKKQYKYLDFDAI